MQEGFETPLSDAEQFRRIWQRVQGETTPWDFLAPDTEEERSLPPAPPKPMPPAPPERPEGVDRAELLRRMLRELAETGCLCRRWPQLQMPAQRCDGQMRRLSAALFLLTGERYRPGYVRCGGGGFREDCRTLYFRFREMEEVCRRAEGQMREPELRELLHELAGECVICKEMVRKAVEESFGS